MRFLESSQSNHGSLNIEWLSSEAYLGQPDQRCRLLRASPHRAFFSAVGVGYSSDPGNQKGHGARSHLTSQLTEVKREVPSVAML